MVSTRFIVNPLDSCNGHYGLEKPPKFLSRLVIIQYLF